MTYLPSIDLPSTFLPNILNLASSSFPSFSSYHSSSSSSAGSYMNGTLEIVKRAASANITNAGQAGVFSGADIASYNASNPITLFLIQLFIIIIFTQGLGYIFKFFRQPRVIAEVIGGIILGPTVMGRIPHFSTTIFPSASLSYLNLVATIGLILFLFLVGLEVDVGVIRRDWKAAVGISAAGIILPFGAGAGLAVALYHEFIDTSVVTFGHFLLFVGVALSITAFPVLCRILTETRLLDTRVGQITLSAGVGNDVVGWILLALTIALAQAGTGVEAVYVLLCAVGWTLVVLIPIKRGFLWLCRRSGSLEGENGPTQGVMLILLMIVFVSAFVTDIIGVHPIFGGFLAGLIVPHEAGFARKTTARLDDVISLIFLPIYFVLSGLKTNLSLLDNGVTWGYTIALCVVAFFGKFIGCTVASMFLGFGKRESFAVGTLMSCKGLVELIVLNVGLAAGILDQRVFSMFVLMALILTFITTPLTLWIYPAKYRIDGAAAATHDRKNALEGGRAGPTAGSSPGANGIRDFTSRFMVVLQKMEHLSAVMLLTAMLEPAATAPGEASTAPTCERGSGKELLDQASSEGGHDVLSRVPTRLPLSGPVRTPVTVEALKLIELTGRTQSVMQSIESETLAKTDDLLQLYKQLGGLRGMNISTSVSVVPQDQYTESLINHARHSASELVIVPWTTPAGGASGAVMEERNSLPSGSQARSAISNPFDHIFGGENDSGLYSHYIRRIFLDCPTDVAVLIDRGFGAGEIGIAGGQHIFMPYFGGADDQLALALVAQLCQRQSVTATVIRFEAPGPDDLQRPALALSHIESASTYDPKMGAGQMDEKVKEHQEALRTNVLPNATTMRGKSHRDAAEATVSDGLAWDYYTSPSATSPHPEALQKALTRVTFSTIRTTQPLATLVHAVIDIIDKSTVSSWRPLLVVAGRGRTGPSNSHGPELAKMLTMQGQNPIVGAEVRKTLGDVATAMAISGTKASLASFLVVQAAPSLST